MQKVHFTGIGEPAMLSIALALTRKNNFQVSGSDYQLTASEKIILKYSTIEDYSEGWNVQSVSKSLKALVVGNRITDDNPELAEAKKIGVKIYTLSEFLFEQTRAKTRIVVCGCFERNKIARMILHVLKKLNMETDYLFCNEQRDDFFEAKLSYDSRIAIFEDFESGENTCFKFQSIRPHIAVFADNPTKQLHEKTEDKEKYIEKTKSKFDSMESLGRIIYYSKNEPLVEALKGLRRDMVAFSYNLPDYQLSNSIIPQINQKDMPAQFTEPKDLLDLNAARIACRQIGIYDQRFLDSMRDY